MRVHYEEIVSAYEQGLQTQLRGFRPMHPFLESWVHDEDPVRSILSMVEAAELGGVPSLDLVIGQETLKQIDQKQLIDVVATVGKVEAEKVSAGLSLRVFLGTRSCAVPRPVAPTDAPSVRSPKSSDRKSLSDQAHPADPTRYYTWAIDQIPEERFPEFERSWPVDAKGCVVRASVGGITLSVLVDPKTHRVLHLKHDAREKGRFQDRALLTVLCSVSRGCTIQDMSEHAVIRAESLLRGQRERSVAGVLQPENAAPVLGALVGLVRDLFQGYIRQTGYEVRPNFEEGPVDQAFSEFGTSTEDLMQRVMNTLRKVRVEGLDVSAPFHVKRISEPRITIVLGNSLPADVQRRFLTRGEELLRVEVNPRLELFLDDKKDENTKRHATEEALGI